MKILRFFSVCFFLSLTLLVGITWGRNNIGSIVDAFVYAIIIPVGVALLLLAGTLAYERYTTRVVKTDETKTALRVFLRITGVLTAGALLSITPALLSYLTRPIVGWTSLFIILPILYHLDNLMEGNQCLEAQNG
ncbi:hypothetical protein [Palaeococcus ferrophilus]|uniref:hypothetical protein n=1 Tax=Palaeococcus ferrophilus TaxID=83868 RepID=UPI00064F2F98|nr:hypothetical protein [Palaeococcus ferrophilus]